MFKFTICLAFIISLVGCATVPMGDPALDSSLKNFKPSPDSSGIYVYRNESMGAAVRMDVTIDGKLIGQSAAKTYFFIQTQPGKHIITSKAENTDSITIETMAGKLYYIWQEVKMGLLYARTKLHLVSEEEGKKGVLESKLAATQ